MSQDEENSDLRKIMLPMVRQVIPDMIAADLLGVQPMASLSRPDPEDVYRAQCEALGIEPIADGETGKLDYEGEHAQEVAELAQIFGTIREPKYESGFSFFNPKTLKAPYRIIFDDPPTMRPETVKDLGLDES